MARKFWGKCFLGQRESPNTPISESGGEFDKLRWNDEYLGSRYIQGLGEDNFNKFISSREMVLVMFYVPDYSSKPYYAKQFVKAAECKSGFRYYFAGVNCLTEKELCAAEMIRNLPAYKLYIGGKSMSNMEDPNNMSQRDIRTHLDAHRIYRGI